ncbi:hypothetical protein CEXT_571521 [Caerostris extrusa]|uniref:Uncharacterized protein n=1 Tax=Caerostris extrusa TaxID=172846 RepID=A0AAV4R4J4_CAEEX|nr:hypothetical protein CEXT_571521 [Caerostris extrusa]
MNHQSNVLTIDDEHARTNIEAANMFTEQYEKTSNRQMTDHYTKHINQSLKITKKITQACNFISDLTLEELDSAIHQ